jgi:hypothetical protein
MTKAAITKQIAAVIDWLMLISTGRFCRGIWVGSTIGGTLVGFVVGLMIGVGALAVPLIVSSSPF